MNASQISGLCVEMNNSCLKSTIRLSASRQIQYKFRLISCLGEEGNRIAFPDKTVSIFLTQRGDHQKVRKNVTMVLANVPAILASVCATQYRVGERGQGDGR